MKNELKRLQRKFKWFFDRVEIGAIIFIVTFLIMLLLEIFGII